MTLFIRLISDTDKESALRASVRTFAAPESNSRIFSIPVSEFDNLPGKPLAYWLPRKVRLLYQLPSFENAQKRRTTRCGLGTLDDFRFLRLWWEVANRPNVWKNYFHGGRYSPFYDSFPLVVNWRQSGTEIKRFVEAKVGSASRKVQGEDRYFSPGFLFPRRTRRFCPKFMPAGGIFSTAGQAGFLPAEEVASAVALMSSTICSSLLTISQGTTSQEGGGTNPQFEVGQVKRLPWPDYSPRAADLAGLAISAWSLTRTMNASDETSLAFSLPLTLLPRLGGHQPPEIEAELTSIQAEIDAIACQLYGLSEQDQQAAQEGTQERETASAADDDEPASEAPPLDGLLSWTVGVAFGRFDWRLATGEREPPPEPEPFDPLPPRSPGMLPEGAEPFHRHPGILMDDRGHAHDLPRLMETVLAQVDAPVEQDLRRWLRKDFFKYHLQQYSRSRRKAPIYWPLSTASGDYTLWVYYPQLTSQTLFTAVNDFVEPKLRQVQQDLAALRGTGSRTSQQERQIEALTDLEAELAELRDTLLRIARGYKPDQDDGVQITAAPLWPLFRHKPWQKVLKETWEKLQAGEYDWAHLAMAYWPDRVREKCRTDRSLAIAHDLEHLYEEPQSEARTTGRSP